MYLNLNRSDKTWETLNTIDKAMPSGVVPDRVELSLHQARASVAIGNLEQSYKYLGYSVTSAVALNSTLRYNEAHEAYKQMKQIWPNERKVRELDDLFIR